MMAYMKWVALLRDAVQEQERTGWLGVLAARTNIPEYRIRDWATKNTIDNLSHSELASIHDALSQTIVTEGGNVVTESEEQREEAIDAFKQRSSSSNVEDKDFSFDESD